MTHKNFSKYIVVALVFVLIGMLSACAVESDALALTPKLSQAGALEDKTAKTDSTDGLGVITETSNTLIVYFAVAENSEVDAISSASVRVVNGEAKGNIRVLADVIHSNVGGDMFSLLTSVKYPANIMKLIDYADKEQKENARPELTSHIETLDDYDIVFIGYPNWWYDLPMIMYSFFEEYDFSGKTIIPFCTHNGSGFSDTIDKIQELEPDATVLDGFTTNGRTVEDVSEDVVKWISGLGI